MKTAIILSFLLIGFLSAKSQMYYESKTMDEFYSSQRASGKNLSENSNLDDIVGSPYLNDNFFEGDIMMTNQVKYEGIPLRYNVYSKCMEFKSKEGDVLQIVETDMIEMIRLNDQTFVYSSYQEDKRIGSDYFECLNEGGEVRLLKKYNIVFQDAQPAQPYSDPEPAKFIKKPTEYYIQIEHSEMAIKFKKTKELIEILYDKDQKLASFIKKNKIKMKDEDLTEAIDYYNSLN